MGLPCSTLLLLALSLGAASSVLVDLNRVLFVVQSQPDARHAQRAETAQHALLERLRASGAARARVLLTHRDDDDATGGQHGAWTYFPLVRALSKKHGADMNWFVFLDEAADVDLEALKQTLSPHYPDQPLFLGHALKDRDHTVVHHYDFPDVEFPHTQAGFALSFALVNQLAEHLPRLHAELTRFPKDFSIDPAYELALVVHHLNDLDPEVRSEPPEPNEPGLRMLHEKRFCPDALGGQETCAVRPLPPPACHSAGDDSVRRLAAQTLIAVKTCKKFHAERLPVVLDTWARAALNVEYFSEQEDAAYQTRALPGVRNTERGHCGKTMAIVRDFHERADAKGWQWLVIADDDTILGVHKLLQLLSCYDSADLVALGQRYGYRIATGEYGYDYITGGGGMVFSRALVAKMLAPATAGHCRCHADDHPDDMHLGACLANLGVSLVHSARFHQARPEDYPEELLKHQDPVSFHKFLNTDPRRVYREWFGESDEMLRTHKLERQRQRQDDSTVKPPAHQEL